MAIAFVADFESCRDSAQGHGAEYVETFDENRQVDADAHALLLDRVLLEQVRVDERNALRALGVLAADLEAVLKCAKHGRLQSNARS